MDHYKTEFSRFLERMFKKLISVCLPLHLFLLFVSLRSIISLPSHLCSCFRSLYVKSVDRQCHGYIPVFLLLNLKTGCAGINSLTAEDATHLCLLCDRVRWHLYWTELKKWIALSVVCLMQQANKLSSDFKLKDFAGVMLQWKNGHDSVNLVHLLVFFVCLIQMHAQITPMRT